MPITARSSRIGRARPKTRRLPTSQSEPPRGRSRPVRPVARIALRSTTSSCESKRSLAAAPRTPDGVRFVHKLVLLRHGFSTWNEENRFTGWTDVDLAPRGIEEAKEAGRLLKEGGYVFDLAYTSVLKRAIRTLWITLDGLDLMWIPVVND